MPQKSTALRLSSVSWPDKIGLLLIILGLGGYIEGPIPYIPGLTDIYLDLRSEMVGIGITALIIDNANQMLATSQEKKRLILQMGSPDNGFAIEAVRQLEARGWLYDGTLVGAKLIGANLQGAKMAQAMLNRSILSGADL